MSTEGKTLLQLHEEGLLGNTNMSQDGSLVQTEPSQEYIDAHSGMLTMEGLQELYDRWKPASFSSADLVSASMRSSGLAKLPTLDPPKHELNYVTREPHGVAEPTVPGWAISVSIGQSFEERLGVALGQDTTGCLDALASPEEIDRQIYGDYWMQMLFASVEDLGIRSHRLFLAIVEDLEDRLYRWMAKALGGA